ncbi:MAG: hypothetical protein QM793_04160 [Muricomes sp.]
MNRKRLLTLLIFAALIIGVFVLVNVIDKSTSETNTKAETETEIKTEADTAGESAGSNDASSEKDAADKLIGETVSREDIEGNIGKWQEFEMSGAGCERGVYAGKFYYDGFTIFSRTYDKGKTFRIISVNE